MSQVNCSRLNAEAIRSGLQHCKPTWSSKCGTVHLWNADCIDVLRYMPKCTVGTVVTDPPYGHNNNSNGDLISRREKALGNDYEGDSRPILNDGPEACMVLEHALPLVRDVLLPGGCLCCCCGGGGPDPQFARWAMMIDKVIPFKHMVVWDKGPMGMGWHYRRSYETVLIAQNPGAKCRWFGGNNVENIIRPGNKATAKIIPKASDHPCSKPPGLYGHFIGLHSEPGDIVLDPFMGAGPCAQAAIRMGRQFWGVELDKQWFDEAVAKAEDAIGVGTLFDESIPLQGLLDFGIIRTDN